MNFADDAVTPAVALAFSGLTIQVKDFVSDGKKPFGVTLAPRVRHGHTEPGRLTWRGTAALAPYARDVLNVVLVRADTSFKGRVSLAPGANGLTVVVSGDAALEDWQLQTRAQAEPLRVADDLLNCKSLNLTGLAVALAPDTAPKVTVAVTVLSDFYARIILDETGRLNLQDITRAAPDAEPSAPAPTAPVTVASVPAAAASSPAVASMAPKIRFGPVSLVAGHVNYTDRFIKPNYSAELSELVGKLSAFSSEPVNGVLKLADLELRGRAQGTASLAVLGKVNPLVRPMALDITGRVRDLELAPLSTYSARYAGYGIERGKLSVDVAYKVQPDGQLTANNKLVLNQLKFGDKVQGARNSLPVKLAVALLTDRNGVIDLDLPISGSLNDPQFRLLPIVFKIIGNLIVKAITASFSLLGSALGGGGDELSMVSFEAGSAALTDSGRAGLAKVPKALQDRPALKMTVVGSASLEAEHDAYKRAQLQALAVQRGVAVRDYLASLKVPMARLFLGATKAVPSNAKWHPRAELKLAVE